LNTDNSRTEIEKILQDDMIIIMSHLYVTLSSTLPGDTDLLILNRCGKMLLQ